MLFRSTNDFGVVYHEHVPKLLDGWSQTLLMCSASLVKAFALNVLLQSWFRIFLFYYSYFPSFLCLNLLFILVVFVLCSTVFILHKNFEKIKSYFVDFSSTSVHFMWKIKSIHPCYSFPLACGKLFVLFLFFTTLSSSSLFHPWKTPTSTIFLPQPSFHDIKTEHHPTTSTSIFNKIRTYFLFFSTQFPTILKNISPKNQTP